MICLRVLMGEEVGDEAQEPREPRMLSSDRDEVVERRKDVRM